MQSGISLHFVDKEKHRWRENRVLRDIASKNRANNKAQCKTGAGWGKMRGKIMEKPSVPMTRLVIRKRAEKMAVSDVMRTIVLRERQRT